MSRYQKSGRRKEILGWKAIDQTGSSLPNITPEPIAKAREISFVIDMEGATEIANRWDQSLSP